VNDEGRGPHSGGDVMAGDSSAVTSPAPGPGTVSGLPPDEPETISRAPVDVRSLSLALLAGIGIVLFLQLAQQVFIPLAVGVLISYALEPIVAWLKRWSIPRAVGAGVLLALLAGGAAFGVFTLLDDAVAVVEKLPAAARKLGESLKVTRGDGQGLMQKMQKAATEMENTTTEAVGPDAIRKGITRVQVEEKPINLGDYIWRGGTGLISAGSAVILVLFLVYFMLITGDLFKRKLMKIAGSSVLSRKITAQILEEIDTQIARYMLIQMMTSVLVGVVSGIAFWWIGLEQAPIWGIAAGLLDAIPYFGPAIVMAGLFTIGFLQFGTILMGLYLAGVSFIIMSLEGLILTPWLTMRAVRMNGVALFLGLMFWGWMWGVWGLLLAVPMMVMIKSISDRIEDLKPIGELLGT
jgi:predicted PurR-regulated permease PerM